MNDLILKKAEKSLKSRKDRKKAEKSLKSRIFLLKAEEVATLVYQLVHQISARIVCYLISNKLIHPFEYLYFNLLLSNDGRIKDIQLRFDSFISHSIEHIEIKESLKG